MHKYNCTYWHTWNNIINLYRGIFVLFIKNPTKEENSIVDWSMERHDRLQLLWLTMCLYFCWLFWGGFCSCSCSCSCFSFSFSFSFCFCSSCCCCCCCSYWLTFWSSRIKRVKETPMRNPYFRLNPFRLHLTINSRKSVTWSAVPHALLLDS